MKKTNLLKITYAPMNEEERAKLQKYFKMVIPIGVFVMLVVAGVTYAMGFDFFSLLIDVLFVMAFVYIYRSFKLDLRENEKKIWQGLITHKDYTVKSNKNSRSTYTYYFHFGDEKKSIKEDIYNQFSIGDFVEIHQAKRVWGVYFDTKLLKENVMPEVVSAHQSERKDSGKKANRFGCFLFLFLGLLMSLWFLIMSGLIDFPEVKEYLEEFMNNLD